MAFDPVAYGQMLDEALGYGTPRGPVAGGGMQPVPGPEIGASPPFRETGEGPWAEELPATRGGRPMQTIDGRSGAGTNSLTQPVGVGDPSAVGKAAKIPAKPPFKIEYRKGALDGVKTFSDVMDAMKPKSQAKYMDWWEQQHGAINERFNQLQKEIGQRPDPNSDLSRKEQFRMLMEFGIELMRRAGQPNAGGESFAQAYGGARGRKAQATADYDAQRGAIEAGRGAELKSIGTYGDALKGQSAIDQDAVQMQEAEARMKAAGRRKPEIISADQGTFDYDPETQQTTAITGIDGKPLTNLKVGSRGGIGRDSRTANQKNIEDLVARGVPEQLAVDIIYKRITDPRKAYEKLYDSARRRFSSEAEAKAEANDIITSLYGEDWQTSVTRPAINRNDPLGLRD